VRKLIEFDHLSIDGRFTGDTWWAGQMKVAPHQNRIAYQLELLSSAVGLVLGRVTYENFAGTWPTMTGDLADRINALPKHVASTTLTETTWNAEVLAGDGRRRRPAQGLRRRHVGEVRQRAVQPSVGGGGAAR
jgi:hypothetical protein